MEASEVSGLIAECCAEVLDTMYFTSVLRTESSVVQQTFRPDTEPVLAFILSFVGDISGSFGLQLKPSVARSLAANFLGEDELDISSDEAAEAASELTNMFCGSVMSRVEREHTFVLSHPETTWGQPFAEAKDCSVCDISTEFGSLTVWITFEGESYR